MVRKFIGAAVVLAVILLLLFSVGYWFFGCVTLEKLGYGEVEIGRAELPSGESIPITPKTLGIEGMTIKEIFEWFRSKVERRGDAAFTE